MPQGKQWQQWSNTNDSWDHNAGRRSKGKGGAKPAHAGKDGAFPSYDAGSGNGSGSSQPAGSKDVELKDALTALFASNRAEIPKELAPFLQPQPGEQLQSDQKKLNAKRKLVSKLDRLRKALDRKKEQWSQFRAQMREHLAKEHARFDQEVAELDDAITTTQLQLDRMLNGETEEPAMETESNAEDLEKMLEEDQSKAATADKNKKESDPATMEALRLAQLGQQQMAKQLMELQQQVLYMSSAFRPPHVGSPVLPPRGTDQPPFTPIRNAAIVPPQGPYVKEKVEPKENSSAVDGKEELPINIEEISD